MRPWLKYTYLFILGLGLKLELLHGNAPGFSASTRVLCKTHLQQRGSLESRRFGDEFDQLKKKNPDSSGNMNPSLGKALGIGKAPNNKSYFLEKLWWAESSVSVNPELRKVPAAEAKRVREGIKVPQHRGELIFVGDKTQARMAITVTERELALSSSQQAANPHVKNTAIFELILNNKDHTVTEASFNTWTEKLITQSQLNSIAVPSKEASPTDRVSKPTYSTRAVKRDDGSIDYIFNIKNVKLPFFRLNYLVENTQRSLAEDDYRATRYKMEEERGIPAHPESDFSQSPYVNGRSPNLDSDAFWQELGGGYESNPEKGKGNKEKDKKNKPQRGNKQDAYYDN